MRRAVIFTLTTILIFIPILLSGFNLRISYIDKARGLSLRLPSGVDINLFDDLSMDVQTLLGVSVNNEFRTINDSLPRTRLSLINNYSAFITEVINKEFSSNISLEKVRDSLDVGGFALYEYGYNFINVTPTSTTINNYLIRIKTNDTKTNEFEDWVWEVSGVYVELNIEDVEGTKLLIKGSSQGFINPNRTNWVRIAYLGGGGATLVLGQHVINNSLYLNATGVMINSSFTLDRKMSYVKTGYLLSISNSVINLTKTDFTTLR